MANMYHLLLIIKELLCHNIPVYVLSTHFTNFFLLTEAQLEGRLYKYFLFGQLDMQEFRVTIELM